MSTIIRPEVSKKNQYWISKHRFYELKHFCLQYPEWKEELKQIPVEPSITFDKVGQGHGVSDPTYNAVLRRENLTDKLKMVEDAARLCSNNLGRYVLIAVILGMSYETLLGRYQIPCCKETYYEAFRKFFWVLSKIRK